MNHKENLSNLVNPNIGTMGHLLTATKPVVSLPHGMMQTYPSVKKENGQRYIKDVFLGMEFEGVTFMPVTIFPQRNIVTGFLMKWNVCIRMNIKYLWRKVKLYFLLR